MVAQRTVPPNPSPPQPCLDRENILAAIDGSLRRCALFGCLGLGHPSLSSTAFTRLLESLPPVPGLLLIGHPHRTVCLMCSIVAHALIEVPCHMGTSRACHAVAFLLLQAADILCGSVPTALAGSLHSTVGPPSVSPGAGTPNRQRSCCVNRTAGDWGQAGISLPAGGLARHIHVPPPTHKQLQVATSAATQIL